VRWISTKGEFAFLSIGGNATGIIAVGGVATGIVAVGAFVSVGVVSIGMNAAGTVLAAGMNTAAPFSFAAINGLGLYVLAGVNAFGAWATSGVNAMGISAGGGTNSDVTFLPAILMIILLVGGSFVVKGARRRRVSTTFDFVRLRDFLRDPTLGERRVHARLIGVRDGEIDLGDGGAASTVRVVDASIVDTARHFFYGPQAPVDVVVRLAREEETVADEAPTDYRAAPHASSLRTIHCLDIEPAPAKENMLPESPAEIRWCLRVSARVAAALAIVAMVAMLFARR
jgi:hypothetical protein